jgi:hypothetical protein
MWKSNLARAMAITIHMPPTRKDSGRRVGVESAGTIVAIKELKNSRSEEKVCHGNYQEETAREGFRERLKKVAVTAGKELPSDLGFGGIFVVQGCGCGRQTMPARR